MEYHVAYMEFTESRPRTSRVGALRFPSRSWGVECGIQGAKGFLHPGLETRRLGPTRPWRCVSGVSQEGQQP